MTEKDIRIEEIKNFIRNLEEINIDMNDYGDCLADGKEIDELIDFYKLRLDELK